MDKKELLFTSIEHNNSLERYSDEQILSALSDEWQEYQEAFESCLIGNDPLELAQEGWDVLRYSIELKRRNKHVAVAETLKALVLADFELTGIDWVEAGLMKEARNRRKYPTDPMSFNGHSPQTYNKLNREAWSLVEGDKYFYYMYMLLGEELL